MRTCCWWCCDDDPPVDPCEQIVDKNNQSVNCKRQGTIYSSEHRKFYCPKHFNELVKNEFY